ncbi:MAG TPA: YchJ family metal-binding protein [Kofleriaceae bacterium]|jgi:SEC-C motif-containing protein
MSEDCPCGSGAAEDACCGPLLHGQPAPTALALMRSRYTAFVRGHIPYLLDTHSPKTRQTIDEEALRQFARDTRWGGLQIHRASHGGVDDFVGIVDFSTLGSTAGKRFDQRELARFERMGGVWYYVDGDIY